MRVGGKENVGNVVETDEFHNSPLERDKDDIISRKRNRSEV